MKLMKRIFLICLLVLAASQCFAFGDSTDSLVPPGVIWAYGGSTAPAGFLLCQGQVVNRADYYALFLAIGTSYNRAAETASQFRIPDMQGVYTKGIGQNGALGSAYTGAAASGTPQLDKFQGHFHDIQRIDQLSFYLKFVADASTSGAAPRATVDSKDVSTVVARAIITDGTNGTPRTGIITEPANVGVNYIIRY